MLANSPAAFLDPILRAYSSSNAIDVSRANLAVFCQNHPQGLLYICKSLFNMVLLYLHDTPGPYIDNRVLQTIANDLSPIVHPLWMAHQRTLKNYVEKARNLAGSASKLNDGPRRNDNITKCTEELEKAYAFLGGI